MMSVRDGALSRADVCGRQRGVSSSAEPGRLASTVGLAMCDAPRSSPRAASCCNTALSGTDAALSQALSCSNYCNWTLCGTS